MKKFLLAATMGLLVSQLSYGQAIDPSELMAGSEEDAQFLGEQYLRPLGNSLAFGLNNGWYQTAKVKTGGSFSIMLTPSLIQIPGDKQSFTIRNSDLEELQLVDPSDNESPTAFGESEPGAGLQFSNPNLPQDTFSAPPGAGIAYMAAPMLGASVGIIKNTELSLRYLPDLAIPGIDGAEIGLFGFGVKHDLLQWIPSEEPWAWNASVFFGYTNLSMMIPLGDDKSVEMNSTGYTLRGVVSKKLSFITPYLGVGYNSGETEIKVNGTFDPIESQSGDELEDPVDFTTKDSRSLTANAGVMLKFLKVIALSVDYTIGNYHSLTVGLGVSVDFDSEENRD